MSVYDDIKAERARQEERWGEQNHPIGVIVSEAMVARARFRCDLRAASGDLTWFYIAEEEFLEAFSEEDPAKRRTELVQLAAVIVAAIESEDRRYRGE